MYSEDMDEYKSKEGKVVVISGPSGVGKTTISKEVVRRLEDAYLSVSVTTRPQASSEVDGHDYWFVSKEEFRRRINEDLFLEHAEVFGNFYGTPKDKIDEAVQSGKVVILEIDVQGARQAKMQYPDAVLIFILPPTQKELAHRINGRGRDDADAAGERLDEASNEIAAAWQYYDNMVINDDLEQAINEVVQIIELRKI